MMAVRALVLFLYSVEGVRGGPEASLLEASQEYLVVC